MPTPWGCARMDLVYLGSSSVEHSLCIICPHWGSGLLAPPVWWMGAPGLPRACLAAIAKLQVCQWSTSEGICSLCATLKAVVQDIRSRCPSQLELPAVPLLLFYLSVAFQPLGAWGCSHILFPGRALRLQRRTRTPCALFLWAWGWPAASRRWDDA